VNTLVKTLDKEQDSVGFCACWTVKRLKNWQYISCRQIKSKQRRCYSRFSLSAHNYRPCWMTTKPMVRPTLFTM